MELSFGGTRGLPLIQKLVKPIKIARSRATNKFRFNKLLVSETQAELRTADTAVLREPDAAMRIEVTRLDLMDGGFYQPAKFLPLFFRD